MALNIHNKPYLCNSFNFNFLTSFQQLGLSDDILKALQSLGFDQPTAIQSQAIPVLLEGHRDFIGLAQTGTGKTAAFGLPLLDQIDPSMPVTQALILAPTRELGQQIAGQLELFSKYMTRVNVLAVYGGAPIQNQIKALRSRAQHVIIATPGRLIDLIHRKAVNLDYTRLVVLDEADEMLNMGFKDELDNILSFTPSDKNTWLFSATMPSEIKRIVNTYMHKPFEVRINAQEQVNTNIEHQYVVVKQSDKEAALVRFLDQYPDMRGVVFCRTRKDTQELAEYIMQKGYMADALHGELSQAQRDKVMKAFKNHQLQVLIATDVAARGIDVQDLTHVFHFALPDDLSYYTHRAGRTARAGKEGISMVFINGRQQWAIQRLERELGIGFTKASIPHAEDIIERRIENWCLEVLQTSSKNQPNQDIYEQIRLMFGNLSKEELIAKLVAYEVNKLNMGDAQDLNEALQASHKPKSSGPARFHERKASRYKHGGSSRGKSDRKRRN